MEALLKVTSAAPFQYERAQYAVRDFPFSELNELILKGRDETYYDKLTAPQNILPLIIQQEEVKRGRELTSAEIRKAKLYADIENQIRGLSREGPTSLNGDGEMESLTKLKLDEESAKANVAAKEEEERKKHDGISDFVNGDKSVVGKVKKVKKIADKFASGIEEVNNIIGTPETTGWIGSVINAGRRLLDIGL